jgi:hypothetical protein
VRSRKSLSAAAVLAAGIGAFAFAVAPTASATPVGVAVSCTSGSSQIGCTVTWRSADSRVAIRWTVNGRHLESADNATSFRLACEPGEYYAVIATVADSTGRESAAARVRCERA